MEDVHVPLFMGWLEATLEYRVEVGKRHYGETFHGRPLAQLVEEILDGLVYVYVARKQLYGYPSWTWQDMRDEVREDMVKWILDCVSARIEGRDVKDAPDIGSLQRLQDSLFDALFAVYDVCCDFHEPIPRLSLTPD